MMKSFGFSRRKHSLKGRKEISRLFRTGKSKTCGFLRFRYLHRNREHAKVVVSVSKRVGNAVLRNRLKRLMREGLRLSGYLNLVSVDCALYIHRPLPTKPALAVIQKNIEEFFEYLIDEKPLRQSE